MRIIFFAFLFSDLYLVKFLEHKKEIKTFIIRD